MGERRRHAAHGIGDALPATGPAAPAVLALVLNAAVWGLSWWPFRALDARGIHPLWATALIYVVALVCITLWRPSAWRGFAAHPMLWLLVAASGLTNVGFNWAVTVGDVVRVVLLFYLMPAWSVLLAWPILGERPSRVSIARVMLALAGVALVMGVPGRGSQTGAGLPDLLAVLGGASFALTNVLLRRLQPAPPESRMLAMFGGGALLAAVLASVLVALGRVPIPTMSGIETASIAAALALAFLVGNIALQYGASRLPAHVTALVMLAEVVFAAGSAAIAGTAEFGLRTLAGGALILGAAAWATRTPADAHNAPHDDRQPVRS